MTGEEVYQRALLFDIPIAEARQIVERVNADGRGRAHLIGKRLPTVSAWDVPKKLWDDLEEEFSHIWEWKGDEDETA